ncbi:membrane bound O-acyl transferase family-domain-containing protein [Phanerochaete sordida]|uniref:Membrane bound O-acyl transferase family-domain-containing protein n=1 Tax=Phanerochaete sordida TaxID=48140 RepID=A0A9P3LGK2_9APHY|nr:membrane bound O-acyl transferase family-domain-containing protein [Phanerochaete sordida]
MPFWEKFYNLQCIMNNTRGIGWNYQIPHVPLLPTESRWRFALKRSLRMLRFILLADVSQTYIDLNPLFSLPEARALSVRDQGLLLQFFNVLAYATRSYCVLTVPYDATAVAAVALGFTEPKAWPTLVGRWKDAYTLRRFWGRVWQQMMRRFVSAGGKFAARTLRCAPGSWLSSHVQLFVGFTLSGLAHVPGDAMVHPKWTGSSFWFFPAQAAAIMLEDAVIARARERGLRDTRWERTVGYLWTVSWLTYSVPWFVDWAVAAGLARDRLPFQPHVVRPVLAALARATGLDVAQWVTAQCAIALPS